MKRWLRRLAIRYFEKKSFQGHAAVLVLGLIRKDLRNRRLTWRQRLWAWRRGFFASRVAMHGIDEESSLAHVPDFDYYRLHPFNGAASGWIDDKLTLRYLLERFRACLPAYYLHLQKSAWLRLPDAPAGLTADGPGLLSLLRQAGDLALKPRAGSLGLGFYHLACRTGEPDGQKTLYLRNETVLSQEALLAWLADLDDYLVTAYVKAHPLLLSLNQATPNTVRLQLARLPGQPAELTGSFIRIGTKESGIQETPLYGALIAGVSPTGRVGMPHRLTDGRLRPCADSTEAGRPVSLQLPHWTLIRQTLADLMDYLPQLSYVGFDVIITDDGFKLIEINSLTTATGLPFFAPLLAGTASRRFFRARFAADPKRFSRILRQIEALEAREAAQQAGQAGDAHA